MAARIKHAEPEREPEQEEEEEGFDFERWRELAGFIWRAPRRHPRLAICTFVAVASLSIVTAAVIPRTYSSDVKILAQRSLVLPALGNPNRSVPREADNPTKNVAETILKREHLVALAKDLNLVDWWDTSRPPVVLFKDKLFYSVLDRPSDADKLSTIVEVLEKRLIVQSDESTVTISVDWSEPKMAYEIISHVEKNFFNAGYDVDVAMINDAIHILDDHERTEKANVDALLAEVLRLQATPGTAPVDSSAPPPVVQRPVTAPPSVVLPPRPTPPTVAASTTVTALAEKRRLIKQLEDERTQRVAELNRQLTEALVTLAPGHRTIIALKQRIDSASLDTPELTAVRAEEQAMTHKAAEEERAAGGSGNPFAPPRPIAATPGTTGVRIEPQNPRPATAGAWPPPENPALFESRDKLRVAQLRHQEMIRRLDAARIEIEVAQASFKYRFSEIRPPEVAKMARKPSPKLIMVGGIFGAFLLALLACAARDRATGVFVEDWQVKRKLGIPVLGTLKLPPGGP